MHTFDYVRVRDVNEAIALLQAAPGEVRPLAGGTELVPALQTGRLPVRCVVDIKGIAPLQELAYRPDEGLYLGAVVTFDRLLAQPEVRRLYPLLVEAARQIASPAVRNRATVGGAVCVAAAYSDWLPALLCQDAVGLVMGAAERRIPLAEFVCGDGCTRLAADELLVGLWLPSPSGAAVGSYQKLRLGHGSRITLVGAAIQAHAHDGQLQDWRMALTAVGPKPFRVSAAEALLNQENPTAAVIAEAVLRAQAAAAPTDDFRAGADYRRAMVGVLVRRGIETVLARVRGAKP
ncbi:MAG: FAD binding domain-containing protein [Caldilineales bacterium]|nr:FAD binding domain-containing protein [Caldilineales bacterium]